MHQTERDPAGLRQLAGAYRLSQAVAAAAGLGVGDVLAAGALDCDAVAAAIGAHAPTLRRLLRALAGEGILSESTDGRVALTELGQCLRSDDPDGTRDMIIGWSCLAEGYLAFSRLPDTVMTGRSGFELHFGQPFHEYMEQHPDSATSYAKATDSTVEGFEAAIAAYDFSGLRTVVDVGGGGGVLLTCLLRAYPAIRGVLFERPAVIDGLRLPADVAPSIDCIPGDALEAIPSGGDAYLFSTVLRCFDDQGCERVLARCREAMAPHATLLALEMVTATGPMPPLAGLADLQALVVYGGADRDEASWRRLINGAGMRLERIQPADDPYSWLVASTQ